MSASFYRFLRTFFVLAMLSVAGAADAQLVEDTNVILGPDSSGIADWSLTVDQFVTQGFDETSIFFDVAVSGADATLTFVDMNLESRRRLGLV